MRTQFRTSNSRELRRHQHIAIAVERHLGGQVAHRFPRERWGLSHRDNDPRVERLQQIRLDINQERERALRTRALVSIDGKLTHLEASNSVRKNPVLVNVVVVGGNGLAILFPPARALRSFTRLMIADSCPTGLIWRPSASFRTPHDKECGSLASCSNRISRLSTAVEPFQDTSTRPHAAAASGHRAHPRGSERGQRSLQSAGGSLSR